MSEKIGKLPLVAHINAKKAEKGKAEHRSTVENKGSILKNKQSSIV